MKTKSPVRMVSERPVEALSDPSMPEKSFQFRDMHVYLAIILATTLIYGKSIFYQYTYADDTQLVVVNEELLSDFRNLPKLFATDVFISIPNSQLFYRPLLNVLFMLEIHLAPNSPIIFHLTNVLLHLLCCVLVFLTLKQLGVRREIAGFASLLFSVHPLNTSAVVWIPGGNDTLLTAFVLSSFLFFLRALVSERRSHLVGHFVFFFLALLTKESAVALPILSLAYAKLVHDGHPKRQFWLLTLLSYVLMTGVWLSLRHLVPQPTSSPSVAATMLTDWFINLPAVFLYLGKLVLPYNLSIFPNLQDDPLWPGMLAVILIATAIALRKPASLRKLVWGFAWFLMFLLPTFVSGVIFHEHRSYCALFGVFFMLSDLLVVNPINLLKRSRIVVGGILLVGLATVSMVHSEHFRDRTAYATNAYLSDPSIDGSYSALAGLFMDEGDDVRAEQVLQKGSERIPNLTIAHRMLGDIYAKRQDYVRATREYETALRLDPRQLYTYVGYGKMCLDIGRVDEAIRLWKSAVAYQPDFVLGYYYIANAYVRLKKDPDSAMIYVRKIQRHGITVMPELLDDINAAFKQGDKRR